MYRAVTSPLAWQITYGLIIATQIVCGILFLAGAIGMWRERYAAAEIFHRAKAYAIAGSLLAFLLWFFVFMVIAGEWFAMWQSQTWNAQEPAFRILRTVLAVLIFVNQHHVDLPYAAPPPKPRRSKHHARRK